MVLIYDYHSSVLYFILETTASQVTSDSSLTCSYQVRIQDLCKGDGVVMNSKAPSKITSPPNLEQTFLQNANIDQTFYAFFI